MITVSMTRNWSNANWSWRSTPNFLGRVIEPLVGSISPVRIFISVDLPAPLGPVTAYRLPGRNVQVTSSNRVLAPKRMEMLLNESKATYQQSARGQPSFGAPDYHVPQPRDIAAFAPLHLVAVGFGEGFDGAPGRDPFPHRLEEGFHLDRLGEVIVHSRRQTLLAAICQHIRRHRHNRNTLIWAFPRSEEHTSELQSPCNLVCRLLLEKKKQQSDHGAAVVADSLARAAA